MNRCEGCGTICPICERRKVSKVSPHDGSLADDVMTGANND